MRSSLRMLADCSRPHSTRNADVVSFADAVRFFAYCFFYSYFYFYRQENRDPQRQGA